VRRGLALVRRLAEVRERLARRALADAVVALGESEGRVAELAARAEARRERLAAEAARGAHAGAMALAYRHVAAVEQAGRREEIVCGDLGRVAGEREGRWRDARRTLKGLDLVLARRAERERRRRERAEQRAVDDLVNSWGNPDATR